VAALQHRSIRSSCQMMAALERQVRRGPQILLSNNYI